MPQLPDRILSSLEEAYGPIALNFVLNTTPQGGAPDDIKEQWIGVELPVREANLGRIATSYTDLLTGEQKNNDNPVSIPGIEAVHALSEAGKDKAAEFWMPYQLGLFTFRSYEGDFQSL